MANNTEEKERDFEVGTLEMLRQYKRHECLWNPNHPLYNCKLASLDALNEIIRDLNIPGLTPIHVKRKLNVIKSNYKQLKRRVLNAKKDGSSFKPKAYWYKCADSFLNKLFLDIESDKLPNSSLNKVNTNIIPLTTNINAIRSINPSNINAMGQINSTNINSIGSINPTNINAIGQINSTNINAIRNINPTNNYTIGNINSTNMNAIGNIKSTNINAIGHINPTNINVIRNIIPTSINAIGSINSSNINAIGNINPTNINAIGSINSTNVNAIGQINSTNINTIRNINPTNINAIGNIKSTNINAMGHINPTNNNAIGYISSTNINAIGNIYNTTQSVNNKSGEVSLSNVSNKLVYLSGLPNNQIFQLNPVLIRSDGLPNSSLNNINFVIPSTVIKEQGNIQQQQTTQNNVNTNNTENNIESCSEVQSNIVNTSTKASTKRILKSKRKIKRKVTAAQKLAYTKKKLLKVLTPKTDGKLELFGKLITEYLKELPPKRQLRCQIAMENALQSYRLENIKSEEDF